MKRRREMKAVSQFRIEGNPVSCERYGNGHINETYLLVTDRRRYILQKINHHIFTDVPALMKNIAAVTEYLRQGQSDPRRTLTLVQTVNGADFAEVDGEYWRVYDFIEDSVCLEKAETKEDFYQSAIAFGSFQRQLAGFPAHTLCETIPRFHDTANRFEKLREAIRADKAGRADQVRREIDFSLAHEEMGGEMVAMLRRGELPLRVTHNDTKLNNVMLDAKTHEPLCVIDLDTVMPGLAGNDFGDSIRFGASTAAEDEENLDKVEMALPLFDAYAKGFLASCGNSLTANEKETLPLAAMLMTLECGIRFLTDYLDGDVYFRIHRPDHNLLRCRTQLKLVADMEKKKDEMAACIRQYA